MIEKNKKLNKAKEVQNDEFYTLYSDIETVCPRFKPYFKNKIIYCNCDNPYKSNFVKFFINHFEEYGLKGLVSSDIDTKKAYFINEVKPDLEFTDVMKLSSNTTADLKTGEFNSPECLDLIHKCDIVITNPPFSLYRKFFHTLIDEKTQFLVISPILAVTYTSTFPYFKSKQVTIAEENHSTKFNMNDKELKCVPITWVTNLPNTKSKKLVLNPDKKYSPEKYSKFDDYPAINVDRIADIPCDYKDVMGVPVTIMEYYLEGGFEIIGDRVYKLKINGVSKFNRCMIKLV